MRKLLVLLALSVLAAPLAARADLSLALNFRGGAAKAWGDVSKGNGLSSDLPWAFPLQGDLAFRFTKELGVGVYARYAPTMLSDTYQNGCNATGASCSASDLGFGALVEYRFGDRLDGGGWVGASVGYELLRSKVGSSTGTATGFEGGLQAGYDFTLAALTIGPFVQGSLGQFSKLKSEAGGQTTTASIADKAMHGWLGVGIRVGILL